MVFRRKISVAVLMTVVMVMLLHAVLPHHHHEEEVCFSDSHCEGTAVIIDHECMDDLAHEHDAPGEEKACNVTLAYILPDLIKNSGKSDFSKILWGSLPVDEELPGEVPGLVSLTWNNHPAAICSLIAENFISLRGPPSIV